MRRAVAGCLAVHALVCLPATAEQPISAERLNELARPLWQPTETGFLREWLICGDFPNPPHEGDTTYDHTPPCVGLETDYLVEHGGEARIQPREGMTHRRPDGKEVAWHAFRSKDDTVDFLEVFDQYWRDNVVGYAFTAITQSQPTRMYLGVGSDDGVRVWVNGALVHEYLGKRDVEPEEDLIPISLRAGENTLLIKVESGSGEWGFRCRLLPDPALAIAHRPFTPKIESEWGADPLVVRTDAVPGAGQLGRVTVEVLRPGGCTIAQTGAHDARLVEFPIGAWPDGPYELRLTRSRGFGRRQVEHLPWFKGDSKAAADRLRAAAQVADPSTTGGMVRKVLADFIEAKTKYASSAATWGAAGAVWEAITGKDKEQEKTGYDATTTKEIHGALMELEELQLAERGELDLARPSGFVRLAYRDPVDDSPQFCRAYLPPGYDPARKWPLIVHLHRADTLDPPYVEWEDVMLRHHPWVDEFGVILIVPHGRGNSWFKGLGAKDVLRCLQRAKNRFSVDENRVYLTGRSMGGGGVWEIGTRFPHLFAALAPVYGGWDDRLLKTKGDLDKLTPRQRFFAETYSSFSGAESLLTTPVFINHGTDDTYVDVNHSRLIVRTMQRWGYSVRYWEHAKKGHEVWSDDQLGHDREMVRWLLGHRRTRDPRHVRLRAPDLKSASVHWVRVGNRSDPLAFIYVDAEVIAPNFVRVRSENALSLTLSPAGELIDPSQPLRVDWNGYGMPETSLVEGKATFHAPDYAPGPLTKCPEREGPLCEAFTTPFAVVVGTVSEDAGMRDAVRRRADDLARQWEERHHCRPRVIDDKVLTDEQKRRWTLILIGGPADNAVTRELSDRIPLRLEGDTIEIDGKAFEAPDALVKLVYPHPLNGERYVVVLAGTSSEAMKWTVHTKDPLGFHPAEELDFYVIDGKLPDEAAGLPEEKVCLVSGYFDHNWRYSEALAVLGDARLREHAPTQGEYSNVGVHLSPVRAKPQRLRSATHIGLERSAEPTVVRCSRTRNQCRGRLCPLPLDNHAHNQA